MSKLIKYIKALSLPIIILVFWEVVVSLGWLPSSLDAKPSTIFITFIKLLIHRDFSEYKIFYNIGISSFRLILGVSIGAAIGVLLAYLNSKIKFLRETTNPFLTVVGPIPIIIWVPIFMLVFNGNDFYKIGLISLATFLLIYLSMFSSFRAIDKKYIELSRIYEKSFWTRFYEISIPHSLEEFLTNIRFSIAIGWIVLFIVEYSNAPINRGGLGYTIERFRKAGKTEEMFASVLLLASISFALDKLVVIIIQKKTKWKSKLDEG